MKYNDEEIDTLKRAYEASLKGGNIMMSIKNVKRFTPNLIIDNLIDNDFLWSGAIKLTKKGKEIAEKLYKLSE